MSQFENESVRTLRFNALANLEQAVAHVKNSNRNFDSLLDAATYLKAAQNEIAAMLEERRKFYIG